ncbi:MAG: PilZ domain-containing protein [Myxococcales bacterium]|nr:PilZ domain-containing protein [Myxococcales bacterium]
MPTAAIRPREGDSITVLIEVNGVPVTHSVCAGAVDDTTLMVPHLAEDPRWDVQPDTSAVVLFTWSGQLYGWQMRVEEVLPSSYFLVSVEDPAAGERRGFVRAQVPVQARLSVPAGPVGAWRNLAADLSAAGVRLLSDLDVAEGSPIDLALRADGQVEIAGQARVVRRFETATGLEIACEFTEISSADEERLAQLVFRTREAGLRQRIRRRDRQ